MIDEKLEAIYADVLRRNPAQTEFHQAVREVLATLGPVVDKHPEFAEHKIIQRICEPERQIIFQVPWQDDSGEVSPNPARPVCRGAPTTLEIRGGRPEVKP